MVGVLGCGTGRNQQSISISMTDTQNMSKINDAAERFDYWMKKYDHKDDTHSESFKNFITHSDFIIESGMSYVEYQMLGGKIKKMGYLIEWIVPEDTYESLVSLASKRRKERLTFYADNFQKGSQDRIGKSKSQYYIEENRDELTYAPKLFAEINTTVRQKCHLTNLWRNQVEIDDDEVKVFLKFNNGSLRSFWNAEVAVQYIFDASLWPISEKIFSDEFHDLNINQISYFVSPRPHDIPSEIRFEITKENWDEFKSKKPYETKEILYRKMKITANGIPFIFDASEAVQIE